MVAARDVIGLLREKHKADVFVPECKFGPTQMTSEPSGRLDAWVMAKSWAHWTTIGYEVKVSRPDFLRDNKWRAYLAHCHEFYFVAPKGVISLDELAGEPVGLLEVASTGTRLFTRRKAPHREEGVDPIAAMIYVLMSRAKIFGEFEPEKGDAEYWRAWLRTKEEERALGREVSRKMGEAFLNREGSLHWRSEQLKRDTERLESLLTTLREWGLVPGETATEDAVREIRERLAFGTRAQWVVDRVTDAVAGLTDTFKAYAEQQQKTERASAQGACSRGGEGVESLGRS